MKATISPNGHLELVAENNMEQFALNRWFDAYTDEEDGSVTFGINRNPEDQKYVLPGNIGISLEEAKKRVNDYEDEQMEERIRKFKGG